MCPRSGRCVSWPLAGSWADYGPGRRDEGPSGSPAVSPLAESPAGAAGKKEMTCQHILPKKTDWHENKLTGKRDHFN